MVALSLGRTYVLPVRDSGLFTTESASVALARRKVTENVLVFFRGGGRKAAGFLAVFFRKDLVLPFRE